MKKAYHITLAILMLFSLTTIGQTSLLENCWGLNKDLSQIRQNDTLQFFSPNAFLYKTYKFDKKGNLFSCDEMISAKSKGRTMKCIWSKIGSWSFSSDTLEIKTNVTTLIFKSISISKDHCEFILNKVGVN